ncbi:hypothetical protein C1N91_14615 [Curtobacterium sp. SGAir0471]|uniref:hypothetical protein n=1 Tax=Curtobacterium sp. SGAir0471 TaxID=2070337 RepID=UPI0010CD380E|nr:hypothetical protein [Curtobacterium sp. SGAir0471]QCR44571.1 hypothetical protein C1N91_14615 [Curtobacterium sp. SGAir0471]
MKTNYAEVSRLCAQVSGYLRGAHHEQAARWYEQKAAALMSDEDVERVALIRAVHESISAGTGGPLGVVLTDAAGRPDVEATTRYKESLDHLYRLTAQSRWRDWLRTFTG